MKLRGASGVFLGLAVLAGQPVLYGCSDNKSDVEEAAEEVKDEAQDAAEEVKDEVDDATH
jgi:hypothetical protein